MLTSHPATVIDVRSPEDFNGPLGHIRDARNVPLATILGHLRELASFRDVPIVLVCRTHNMSSSAAEKLATAGFTDIRVLRGGMVRWNECSLPINDRNPQREESQ